MDWAGLIVVSFAAAYGLFSWRWSVPYYVSIYKMVMAREPDRATFRGFQFSRWFGVVFSAVVVFGVVFNWIRS